MLRHIITILNIYKRVKLEEKIKTSQAVLFGGDSKLFSQIAETIYKMPFCC